MFETIKRLYAKTGNETLVANAVKKGWITEEQYAEIVGKETVDEEAVEEVVDDEIVDEEVEEVVDDEIADEENN